MKNIQDSEYILYKALVSHVKMGLEKPLNRLNLKCLNEFSKFEKQNALFMNCETYEDLGDNSKKLKVQKKKLLELLAVQDRIEKILKRNEQRLEVIGARLSQVGIYNDSVDKKTFNSELSNEQKNVNESTLNLNPKENNGLVFKSFAGEILAFKDDVLDLSIEENTSVLMETSADFFHELVFTFPYSVATIPDEIFMLSSAKNNILKECIMFVASKLKVQSIAESNKELGSLLEGAGRISDISQFARELRNYFNVIVKQCIKSQAPELSEDADKYLRCSEGSEFLPFERRVAGAKSEVLQEPEEDKKEDKKEKQKLESESESSEDGAERGRTTEQLLDLLLSDDDDDLEETNDSESSENNAESSNEETQSEASSEKELDRTLKELEALLLADEDDDEDDEKGGSNG